MRPQKVIDASQAWFWTPEWQAGEREADEEAARGGGEVYMDEESFQAAPGCRAGRVVPAFQPLARFLRDYARLTDEQVGQWG